MFTRGRPCVVLLPRVRDRTSWRRTDVVLVKRVQMVWVVTHDWTILHSTGQTPWVDANSDATLAPSSSADKLRLPVSRLQFARNSDSRF